MLWLSIKASQHLGEFLNGLRNSCWTANWLFIASHWFSVSHLFASSPGLWCHEKPQIFREREVYRSLKTPWNRSLTWRKVHCKNCLVNRLNHTRKVHCKVVTSQNAAAAELWPPSLTVPWDCKWQMSLTNDYKWMSYLLTRKAVLTSAIWSPWVPPWCLR